MNVIINQIEKTDGKASVYVVFTDNVSIKVGEWIDVNTSDLDSFKRHLQARAAQIQNQFNFIDTLVVGPLDLTTSSIIEDVDKKQFFSNYLKLQQLNTLKNTGVLEGTEKEYLDLLNIVKAGYKPEYFI